VETTEFLDILSKQLYNLANDVDIPYFSPCQNALIHKEIYIKKSWKDDIPMTIIWEIGTDDAGSHIRGSGEIVLEGAFFISSPLSTPPDVVDFIVVNVALHEIIGHGLLLYLLRVIRATCFEEPATSIKVESIDSYISKDSTPPHKLSANDIIHESGLAVECLMTGGFELTFCGKPGKMSRKSILHAACVDVREGAGRKKWRIDHCFITEILGDLQHYFSHLLHIKDRLLQISETDRVLHTRTCLFQDDTSEVAHIPGQCRRRLNLSA
jgi:hypothetical protein